MKAYVDASVFLRLTLNEPGRLRAWGEHELYISSVLAEVESFRTLDRARLSGRLSEGELVERRETLSELLSACELVSLARPIMIRAAETFPVALGTLDALHLATALSWREARQEDLLMATHDMALALAARSLGFKVIGV